MSTKPATAAEQLAAGQLAAHNQRERAIASKVERGLTREQAISVVDRAPIFAAGIAALRQAQQPQREAVKRQYEREAAARAEERRAAEVLRASGESTSPIEVQQAVRQAVQKASQNPKWTSPPTQ